VANSVEENKKIAFNDQRKIGDYKIKIFDDGSGDKNKQLHLPIERKSMT